MYRCAYTKFPRCACHKRAALNISGADSMKSLQNHLCSSPCTTSLPPARSKALPVRHRCGAYPAVSHAHSQPALAEALPCKTEGLHLQYGFVLAFADDACRYKHSQGLQTPRPITAAPALATMMAVADPVLHLALSMVATAAAAAATAAATVFHLLPDLQLPLTVVNNRPAARAIRLWPLTQLQSMPQSRAMLVDSCAGFPADCCM